MLAAKPISGSGLNTLLLYHFLLITGGTLIILPLLADNKKFELTLLIAILIILTSLSTIIGLSIGHRITRTALGFLFAIWMLVWCVHLT